MNSKKCTWAKGDPLLEVYHDTEWGIPLHDDQKLFEFLCLESAQAGLSWLIVLKKRDNYRKAFDNFDPIKISKYDDSKVEVLMKNPGIIRNKLKINAVINNAKQFIKVQKEYGSFDSYIWNFVKNTPIINSFDSNQELPAQSDLSLQISKDLKKRGFKFVGPTIVYAHMQATGMVNDHLTNCFRYKEVNA